MFVIYNSSVIPDVDGMIAFWNEELKKEGFDGIYIVEYISTKNPKPGSKLSQAVYEDEPMFTCRFEINNLEKFKRVVAKKTLSVDYQDYDRLWELILKKNRTYEGREIIQGCFTAWDNSPRRGDKGSTIIKGSDPEKFRKYFIQLINNPTRKDVSDEYVIINAWNEWGEGAILEPSVKDGYGYLEAVQYALSQCK